MKTLLFVLLVPLHAAAFEAKHEFKSYEDAEKASSFLRFDLDTKKMGLFKSHMTGYVLKFESSGKIQGDSLSDAVVSFRARDMDTDLYARNDQMWNNCLDAKKYEKITLRIPHAKIDGSAVNAEIDIRGKKKVVPVKLKYERAGGKEVVSGESVMTFKDLEIPDPSIGVASVSDEITVRFRIED